MILGVLVGDTDIDFVILGVILGVLDGDTVIDGVILGVIVGVTLGVGSGHDG